MTLGELRREAADMCRLAQTQRTVAPLFAFAVAAVAEVENADRCVQFKCTACNKLVPPPQTQCACGQMPTASLFLRLQLIDHVRREARRGAMRSLTRWH